MSEKWTPVAGYERLYKVCSDGRVMSLRNGRNLRPIRARGYVYLNLHGEASSRRQYVHRIVMAAFIGPCPAGYEVNHRDGNKLNNQLENLEYVTPSENKKHAYRVLHRPPVRVCGLRHGRAIVSDADVAEMRELRKRGWLIKDLASKYGLAWGTTQVICANRRRMA